MKRAVLWRAVVAVGMMLAVLLSLVSCREDVENTPEGVFYTVTFDSMGGSEIASKIVPAGAKIPDPGAPEREGYVFSGWIRNGAKWDFSTRTVQEDMTLTAQWFSAESVFAYEIVEETQTVRITRVKEKMEEIEVPGMIAGFPVTEIGDGVFASLYANAVKRIRISAGITAIGNEAFMNSAGIEILFEEGCALTSIGENAFLGCTGLRSVPLGEGLTELVPWSFSECTALREIQLPESLKVIGENAFGGCTSLKTVMMHKGVETVEDGAFEDCDALETIYFYGSAEEIDALLEEGTANMNDALEEAEIYLYSEQKPSAEGAYGFWHWDENQKIRLW